MAAKKLLSSQNSIKKKSKGQIKSVEEITKKSPRGNSDHDKKVARALWKMEKKGTSLTTISQYDKKEIVYKL